MACFGEIIVVEIYLEIIIIVTSLEGINILLCGDREPLIWRWVVDGGGSGRRKVYGGGAPGGDGYVPRARREGVSFLSSASVLVHLSQCIPVHSSSTSGLLFLVNTWWCTSHRGRQAVVTGQLARQRRRKEKGRSLWSISSIQLNRMSTGTIEARCPGVDDRRDAEESVYRLVSSLEWNVAML